MALCATLTISFTNYVLANAFLDGPQISYYQLTHWMRCEIEPENFADLDCAVFEDNHPNAMALSVLVTIEMLNAVNRFVDPSF